jgi:Uma2 family endonuclease
MISEQPRITIKDFWKLAKDLPDDTLVELVNGALVTMNPPRRVNSWLAAMLIRRIGDYLESNQLGIVLGADGGYILNDLN